MFDRPVGEFVATAPAHPSEPQAASVHASASTITLSTAFLSFIDVSLSTLPVSLALSGHCRPGSHLVFLRGGVLTF
jgi:hypothetical protein